MKLKYKIVSIALATFATIASASAQDIEKMTSFDFLVQYDDLKGKTVEIDDCLAVAVSIDRLLCNVNSATGNVGNIYVRLKNAPKKDLVYGLKKCASLMPDKKQCSASISGEVIDSPANATIEANAISWNAEKK
ncbi:hypothetical protein [Bartonella sp. LJL80]